jgi:hypothetical protein
MTPRHMALARMLASPEHLGQLPEFRAEIREELADVPGWAALLWRRLGSLEEALPFVRDERQQDDHTEATEGARERST